MTIEQKKRKLTTDASTLVCLLLATALTCAILENQHPTNMINTEKFKALDLFTNKKIFFNVTSLKSL